MQHGWWVRGLRSMAPIGALSALSLAVLATSEPGRVAFSIPLQGFGLGLPAEALPVATHEARIRRIARVLRDDLGLPLPDRVMLHLYATPDLFAHHLVGMGVAPSLAADLGGFAAGVTFDRHLLFLEPELRRGGHEALRLVAHEMTHLAQFELAGGEGRASHWLTEGMAEWVAYRVLDRIGVRAAAGARSAILDAVHAHLRGEDADGAVILDLTQLDDPLAFYERGRRDGLVSTYRLAFAMTDRLIDRHGFDRLVTYFRSFEHAADRQRNFQRAFGYTLQDFEREALLGPLARDPARP
jgi:hypothetical protein